MRRTTTSGAVAVVFGSVALVGCSTGDGRDLDARPAPVVVTTAASQVDSRETGPTGSAGASVAPVLPAEPVENDRGGGGDPLVATSLAEVPEVGVPGLDADDEFCAAWSRFAGSFQVIAVSAAFGDGTPESVARLEVLASGTANLAYADLEEFWPPELESERGRALVERLGPFFGRMTNARGSLGDAGALAPDRETIELAWENALATRDPDIPTMDIDVAPELAAMVELAAGYHLDEAGSWFDDESLVTDAETPLTDAYLIEHCPDRGTLAGQVADG